MSPNKTDIRNPYIRIKSKTQFEFTAEIGVTINGIQISIDNIDMNSLFSSNPDIKQLWHERRFIQMILKIVELYL
jgi:hypothetical protein